MTVNSQEDTLYYLVFEVVISWMYMFVKTDQIEYFLFYVNYTSVKFKKLNGEPHSMITYAFHSCANIHITTWICKGVETLRRWESKWLYCDLWLEVGDGTVIRSMVEWTLALTMCLNFSKGEYVHVLPST